MYTEREMVKLMDFWNPIYFIVRSDTIRIVGISIIFRSAASK